MTTVPYTRTPPQTQLLFNAETVQWDALVSTVRALLTKHALTRLPTLPPGCTFGVAAYTLRDAPSSRVNPQLWVEELAGPTGKCDVELPDPFTVETVKLVHVQGVGGMQFYVETPPIVS